MPASAFDQRYFELSNQDPYVQSVRRPGGVIVKKMPYDYGATIGGPAPDTPLTFAAGAVNEVMTTLGDSDFVLSSMSASVNATVNGNMLFNRNLTLQIQDLSSGKFFFQVPTVVELVTGGGGFPFEFVAPRVMRPNSSFLLTAQNRDTAQNYNAMFVTFHGTRYFYAS